jgi:hypothetical protein
MTFADPLARASLNLTREFSVWQAGQLSAGLAASISAFERRRGRQQQRGTFAAWRESIDNRKTAQFKLRHCIQTWQANRVLHVRTVLSLFNPLLRIRDA